MKKVGKITRQFRYDLNQNPNNYTVEVTNRFKELDLIECFVNYGQRFMTLYGDRNEDHPKGGGGNGKNENWLSEEALQIVVKSKEKRKDVPI